MIKTIIGRNFRQAKEKILRCYNDLNYWSTDYFETNNNFSLGTKTIWCIKTM